MLLLLLVLKLLVPLAFDVELTKLLAPLVVVLFTVLMIEAIGLRPRRLMMLSTMLDEDDDTDEPLDALDDDTDDSLVSRFTDTRRKYVPLLRMPRSAFNSCASLTAAAAATEDDVRLPPFLLLLSRSLVCMASMSTETCDC